MPKIAKKNVFINGVYVELEISYNQKRRFHVSKGLAAEINRFSDNRLFGFSAEDDLHKEIKKALDAYHDFIKKTRKVIAYNMHLTTEMGMNRRDDYSFSGKKTWVPETISAGGLGLKGNGFALHWKVMLEEAAEKTKYYEIEDDGSVRWEDKAANKMIIVEWTKEREEAFKGIDKAMEEMVKKMASVIGDKEKTLSLLDSGMNLLPLSTS